MARREHRVIPLARIAAARIRAYIRMGDCGVGAAAANDISCFGLTRTARAVTLSRVDQHRPRCVDGRPMADDSIRVSPRSIDRIDIAVDPGAGTRRTDRRTDHYTRKVPSLLIRAYSFNCGA